MKSYLFQVALVEEVAEADGRWSAAAPTLPGCATCGDTREEALDHIRDAVEASIRDMQTSGEEIPKDATLQVMHAPVVAVTV